MLVLGISPRLPFDSSYETFFQLVAARIAGLLQSEVQRSELVHCEPRYVSEALAAAADPFGMVIGNLNGDLKYVSPALLANLSYSEADVIAGRVRWDHLTPPEFAPADARAVAQLRATGRCEVYEKVYRAKDGAARSHTYWGVYHR